MKVIVFGASGFVGGWICEALNSDAGVELIACIRRWAGASRLARRGIEMIQVDLDSAIDLAQVVSGADVVINAAIPSSDREPELALKLYVACAQARVRRYIQFSSAALYGDLTGNVNEDTSPTPIDDYGRGKAEMERSLLQATLGGGPQLFILRPSIVYGPYGDAWTVRYAQRIVAGSWRNLGNLGKGTCNLVHAHDVARAVICCAKGDVAAGSHVLNINGPDVVSWNEYIERFGAALEVPNREIPGDIRLIAMVYGSEMIRVFGKWLLSHFQKPLRKISQSGKAGPAIVAGAKSLANLYPTTGEVKLLRRQAKYDWSRAESELGFRPTMSLDDGLKQSANWCRIHGVV